MTIQTIGRRLSMLEELLNKSISIEELVKLCYKYDCNNGSYPENKYEGLSVHRLQVF